jgi:hypothetical protein
MAPTPSATSDLEDSVLFKPFSDSDASSSNTESGLVFQIDILIFGFIVIKHQMYRFLEKIKRII